MTTREILRGADGSITVINFAATDGGSLVMKEADMNAVMVQMFEAPQEDGTMLYRKVVSIVCRDAAMLDALKEEAFSILRVRP